MRRLRNQLLPRYDFYEDRWQKAEKEREHQSLIGIWVVSVIGLMASLTLDL